MTRSLPALLLAAVLAFAAGARAQSEDDAPLTLPELKRVELVIQEIEYPKTLPSAPVAKVDGHVLTQADLLKRLLESNLSSIANNLLMAKMVDIEAANLGVELTPEELQQEIDEMMPRLAPGKTLDEVVATGVYNREYIERVARMNRLWKKLFWQAKNIDEAQRGEQANQFLMQIYMNEIKQRYQLALRGRKPEPPRGAIAALNTIVDGKRVSYVISAEEAIEFLVGLLRPATILQGRDSLVDDYLVRRAMERAGVSVTEGEVEAWVQEMQNRYPPPLTWETILKLKGTSPDAERTRWRNVQAWKRVTRDPITAEELEAFRIEHDDFFRSRHVKVSHVLVRTTDPITGLEYEGEKAEQARRRAERILQLAREGVEMDKLARLYSDDEATAANGGAIGQPVKKWGGGYDESFQKAAYGLEKNELSEPVKSAFGWHVILCTEVSPASNKDFNWNDSRYAEWVLEEYETIAADAWIDGMREQASIELTPQDQLLRLKSTAFPAKND